MTAAGFVDEVAVERASAGHRVRLTRAERLEVVRALTARGVGAPEIASRLRVTPRTVLRERASLRDASRCACGRPLTHLATDPDGPDWACRVPLPS